jgi:AcrR family transcriptional regulator
MARPKRIIQKTNLDEAIQKAAWLQIQEQGAAALTLRGIARQLGIAAPSIYHYYPSRDALVTALILEAFNCLAESLREAASAAAAKDYPAQLAALGQAYRQWAIVYPQRYQLIFGTPIPGYFAPEEVTLPAAVAGFVPLTETLQAAFTAGRLRLERLAPLTPALGSMLEAWKQYEGQADIEVLYLALVFWSRIHGLMMFEVNGQYPSFITDPGEVYEREVKNVVIQYFGLEKE